MKLLLLFYEFAKVGLFSVGGGLATVPFLQSMGEKTGWFTNAQLSTMIAVSESTPGPMGVNMATYVGYSISGIPGAVIATLGLITPSIAVIIIIGLFAEVPPVQDCGCGVLWPAFRFHCPHCLGGTVGGYVGLLDRGRKC